MPFSPDTSPVYLDHIRQALAVKGLTMPMMCYSPDFTIPDRDLRQEQVEKERRIMTVTAELGGQFCRVLSGQRRPDVSRAQGMNWVVECIEACCPPPRR